MRELASTISIVLCLALGMGCASSSNSPVRNDRTIGAPGSGAQAEWGSRVMVQYAGGALTMADLLPTMIERAGGEAIELALLDRLLTVQLANAGLVVGEPQFVAERDQLLASQASYAGAFSDEERTEIYRAFIRERGLSDEAFRALIRRNAMLRALVAPTVSVSDLEIRRAHGLIHGEKYLLRLIVTSTATEAADARRRIREGEGPLGARFAQVARAVSTDGSAEAGGLIDPVSPLDPIAPRAILETMNELAPGELSEVFSFGPGSDGRAGVLMVEAILPPDGVTLDTSRERISHQLRLGKERLAMQELGVRLIRDADVVVLDEALFRSWLRHTRARSDR